MDEMLTLIKKDTNETIRTKAFLLSIVAILAFIYLIIAFAPNSINTLLRSEFPKDDMVTYVRSIVNSTVFTVSLVVAMYFSLAINSQSLLIEKTKRCLESLLCTPLSLMQLWIAKTLAMFIPSLLMSWVFMILTIITMNVLFILPKLHVWIYPAIGLTMASVIGIPLIVLFLSAILYLLQLIITNARVINIIFTIFLIVTLNSLLLGPKLSSSSWAIFFICDGIALVLAFINLFMSRLLTKERVILSSKG
jgi:ABC-2 type transport system permease protein